MSGAAAVSSFKGSLVYTYHAAIMENFPCATTFAVSSAKVFPFKTKPDRAHLQIDILFW